jgi:predicted MPP superfamily phosphohydrolase
MGARINALSLILGALLAYIGVRLLGPFPLPAQVLGGAVLLAIFWLLPKGFAFRSEQRWRIWAPWLMTGLFSWLLVLTLARDFVLVGASWLTAPEVRGEWVRLSALAVMALTPLITAIGYAMARRTAPVVDITIPIEGLARALEGFTIAQISDIHVGPTIKRPYVDAIVDRVNGLKADMVAITGDLVDGSVADLSGDTAPLARLASRHGTYIVTGNHEYYSGARAWVAELRRLGASVLLNEHVVLDHDGSPVTVAGVTDYSAHHFDPSQRSDAGAALAGAPASSPKVLLAHQPRSAAQAVKAGADLQLSGHTHGGQFWPWNLFVRLQQPFTAGLHRLGRMWVYTNRGTGYWGPPMRFGIPSEITRIRLVRAG